MGFYVKALQQGGFEVEQRLDPDAALEFARVKSSRIKAIILDIMMRPGKTYADEDTNEGLKTGILLYDSLKALCPKTLIIVLTNVKSPEMLKKFYDLRLDVRQKKDCPPFALVDLVKERISSVSRESVDNENHKNYNAKQKGGSPHGS